MSVSFQLRRFGVHSIFFSICRCPLLIAVHTMDHRFSIGHIFENFEWHISSPAQPFHISIAGKNKLHSMGFLHRDPVSSIHSSCCCCSSCCCWIIYSHLLSRTTPPLCVNGITWNSACIYYRPMPIRWWSPIFRYRSWRQIMTSSWLWRKFDKIFFC